jgi:DNA polymerase-3 subunit delta
MNGERLDVNTLIDSCETLPLMDTRRLVVVRDYDLLNGPRGTASDADQIIDYIKKIPEHLILVFYCTEKADARKKLYKALGKNEQVGIYSFDRLKESELIQWIYRECKKENVNISQANAELLVSNIGNDMLIIRSEIEKLIACAGEQRNITGDMIHQLTETAETETVFMLMDYIGKQNAAGAYVLARRLVNDGVEPMNILALIARQFRLLIQVRGIQPNSGNKKIKGLPSWAIKKYIAQSKQFKDKQLFYGIKLCAEMNNGLKNGTYVDQKAAIELLIMKICTNHFETVS